MVTCEQVTEHGRSPAHLDSTRRERVLRHAIAASVPDLWRDRTDPGSSSLPGARSRRSANSRLISLFLGLELGLEPFECGGDRRAEFISFRSSRNTPLTRNLVQGATLFNRALIVEDVVTVGLFRVTALMDAETKAAKPCPHALQ